MELVSADVGQQTEQALKNLASIAEDNGFTLEDAVKCNLYIVEMTDFAKVNEAYKKAFGEGPYPGRTCVAVKELPKGAKFEIEAVFFKSYESKL